MIENKVREIVTPQALKKIIELDFGKRTADKEQGHSQEDKKFLKIFTQGIRRTEDGHYEIPLPFHRGDVRFPENKEQLPQRARWLRKKPINNETFCEGYVNFMTSITAKGFAWKVPSDGLFANTGQVWRIPHHGSLPRYETQQDQDRVRLQCQYRRNITKRPNVAGA